MRQALTVSPSSITEHAPQMPCSQPTCVPVRRSSSRSQSTSDRRAGTVALRGLPFTSTEMRCSNMNAIPCRTQGAGGEHPAEMAPVVGARMQVAHRLALRDCLTRRGADGVVFQGAADEAIRDLR